MGLDCNAHQIPGATGPMPEEPYAFPAYDEIPAEIKAYNQTSQLVTEGLDFEWDVEGIDVTHQGAFIADGTVDVAMIRTLLDDTFNREIQIYDESSIATFEMIVATSTSNSLFTLRPQFEFDLPEDRTPCRVPIIVATIQTPDICQFHREVAEENSLTLPRGNFVLARKQDGDCNLTFSILDQRLSTALSVPMFREE